MGFSEFKWPPRKVPSWKIVHLVFVPIFFWSHYTCGGVRKRFWGKNFQGRPKKKKSKKVNKILFPFPFPFPVIPKNGGLWFPFPNFGNGFFHSLPVPEFWEWIFFIPFPFPNFGNGIFSFPSHSRNLGMDFFIPFPFPNPQKSFPLTPVTLALQCVVVTR